MRPVMSTRRKNVDCAYAVPLQINASESRSCVHLRNVRLAGNELRDDTLVAAVHIIQRRSTCAYPQYASSQ